MKKLIAIVGPTASGKTGIGVRLAKELNGEIISADSRQVYRGLDIGTGKEHLDDIPQWLINIVNPHLNFNLGGRMREVEKNSGFQREKVFSVFDWLVLARAAIEDIFRRGKVPIIVGGTGLYIQGLIEGFALEQTPKSKCQIPNTNLKSKFQNLNSLSLAQQNQLLKEIDFNTWQKIDKQNPHRLKRAIERAFEGIKPTKKKPDFEVLQIGLNLKREELFEKIDDRVEERFEKGMLEEIINLLRAGVSIDWMIKIGLEYKIIGQFVWEHSPIPLSAESQKSKVKSQKQLGNRTIEQSKIGLSPSLVQIEQIADHLRSLPEYEVMNQELKWKIHAFARRQLTWFRRFPEIVWLNNYQDIRKEVSYFLNRSSS